MGNMGDRLKRLAWVAAVAVAIVVLDQLTKVWARTALAAQSMIVIPGVIDFHLVFNSGAAFGLGSGGAAVFIVASLVVVVGALAYIVFGRPWNLMSFSIALVCGGAIGNVIDRIDTGLVTDFIMTTFVDFPVFNVADIAITCGYVLFFITLIFHKAPQAEGAEGAGAMEGAGAGPAASDEGSDAR